MRRFLDRFTARVIRLVLSSLARVRCVALDPLPRQGPLIIVANHVSLIDPLLIGGWLQPVVGRRIRFLAKEQLFSGPLGWLLTRAGAIPVRAGGSDVAAYRAARAALEAGEVVCIFPEGTRSPDGRLGRPFPGVAMLAARSDVPVAAVGIAGALRFLPRGARLPRLGTRITLRVGAPFRLHVEPGVARRVAVARASDELMGHIAQLLPPPERGPRLPAATGSTR
ncbi:MAG TPA: lysophospholipid acyltransferase family protein [Candidatus Limnocylindrales bacterium]|nr:lysophospholipid acyltransferase family protein [Candidatus Limnocylindrales bacterium]